MIRVLVLSLVTLSAVVAWNISVFFATSEGWLKSPIVKSDSAQAFAAAAEEAPKKRICCACPDTKKLRDEVSH